jgi:hypothetical protein
MTLSLNSEQLHSISILKYNSSKTTEHSIKSGTSSHYFSALTSILISIKAFNDIWKLI